MPFVLIAIGAMLAVAGVRGTQAELFDLLKGDFTGTPNYISWMVAIMVIGALGYINAIRPISNAFLVLVILVLFISNRGFFAQFNQQLGISKVG